MAIVLRDKSSAHNRQHGIERTTPTVFCESQLICVELSEKQLYDGLK